MALVVDPAARSNGAEKSCGEGALRAFRSSCTPGGRGDHLFAYRIMDMRWMYDKRQSVAAVEEVKAGRRGRETRGISGFSSGPGCALGHARMRRQSGSQEVRR